MINVYATKEDYSKYGNKSLEDNEIEKYLELASIDINKATLTRIEKRGFKNLTSQQQYLITKATCIQADYIKENGLYEDTSISSYSISGDLTINEKEPTDIANKLNVSSIAFSCLQRTGLTNRIL